MKPGVRIRSASSRDVPALLALEEQFPSDRLSPRSVRHLLRSKSARVLVVPAPDLQSPISTLRLAAALILLTRKGTRSARIYSLVVDPLWRGHGLAQQLVRRAEAEARRRRCRCMSLEVRASNRAARALYAKLGYTEAGRLPAYYDDGAAGLRLQRPLTSGA